VPFYPAAVRDVHPAAATTGRPQGLLRHIGIELTDRTGI
jgi:hypothetical protein